LRTFFVSKFFADLFCPQNSCGLCFRERNLYIEILKLFYFLVYSSNPNLSFNFWPSSFDCFT